MFKLRSLFSWLIRNKVNDFNVRGLRQTLSQIKPEYDTNYLTNPANYDEIRSNIAIRKGVGNIELVHDLANKLNQTTDATDRENLYNQLQVALKSIPNSTHPDVVNYGDNPKEIETIGSKTKYNFKYKDFERLCKAWNVSRTTNLRNFNGSKSYYLMDDLALLVSLFATFDCAGHWTS